MIPAARAAACLALLLAGLTGGSAAGQLAAAPQQLAFLRAYPQPAAVPAVPDAAARQAHSERANPAHQTLENSDFYDPTNPDRVHLQRHDDAVASIPTDANGFPDWMRALRQGIIQPRAGLAPDAAMGTFDLDVIMKNTKEMPHVRFPHAAHTMWLDCSNCHPQPFEPRAGATRIPMADIFRGKYCGMCHDRVAFITFFSCQRCHSVPHASSAAP